MMTAPSTTGPNSSPSSAYSLSDRYLRTEGTAVLTGIQALARLPIEQLRLDQQAGLNTAVLASGYPGSPLGGFDQEIARAVRLVPELPIVLRPAVNEELGATTVMGTQLASVRPDATYDGVVGVWYGKAPGLDRAGDALRHAVFAGTSAHGGAVALVGDDPACKSSTMPSSSDATFVDLHMPVLYPGTVAECLELGLHAIAISRSTGLWSAMKIVTPVADGSGSVHFPVLDRPITLPSIEINSQRWQPSPSAMFLGADRMLKVEREFREIRLPLANTYGKENGLNRVTSNPTDAWLGIISTGFTYQQVLEAFRRLGFATEDDIAAAGIRLLQLRMPVPFDADLARNFARDLEEIVVVEEKNATLEVLIKEALYGTGHQPRIVGKRDDQGEILMQAWGHLDADAIVGGLRKRLEPRLASRLAPAPPKPRTRIPLSVARTPFFCSGCPHNWGTKVPDGALVGAGTGCHGMTLLMDEDRVGESIGITAMGNEGAQWIGMEPFVEKSHLFQNYGDGTYFHSGQLAVQYCIGAGVNITFKILYNDTVAMTGGQDSIAPLGVPELATTLLAQGVKKVAITTEDPDRYRGVSLPRGVDVRPRDEIVAVQEDLQTIDGVTVLIHDQYCAAELRRDRKRGRADTPTKRIVINHRICEGCGDCGDVSNCLSVQPIETPLGRKTTIDQGSCNFDYSCAKGDCPAFMIVESDPDQAPFSHSSSSRPSAPPADLVPPALSIPAQATTTRLRLAGIGGTGVVTVAQILATAAMLDGWDVQGLDQTGLSQKAGPVISDVILTRPGVTASNVIGTGEADVILGFDALVAASDTALAAADPARTAGVISTTTTPTGKMISQPTIPHPGDEISDRLAETVAKDAMHEIDTGALAEALCGSRTSANLLLLGAAIQLGLVPVTVESLSTAIELNGVAVEANQSALQWGRCWAADSQAVEEIAASASPIEPTEIVTVPEIPASMTGRIAGVTSTMSSPDAADEVTMLTADLIGYQDETYAKEFLDAVETVRAAETRVNATSSALTMAVARNLHRLMAYKDEYEVARLMLLPEARAAAEHVGGKGASMTWMLHPPTLKSLGRQAKIPFGEGSAAGFKALAKRKGLRGSRLDPFGQSSMRRLERALPREYLAAIDVVCAHLEVDRLPAAVAIANLPDMVRGFEDLKIRRIAEYRKQLADGVAEFSEPRQ